MDAEDSTRAPQQERCDIQQDTSQVHKRQQALNRLVWWPRSTIKKPVGEQLRWPLHAPAIEIADTEAIVTASGDMRLAELWKTMNEFRQPHDNEKSTPQVKLRWKTRRQQ